MENTTQNKSENVADLLREVKQLRSDQKKERDRKRKKKNISIVLGFILMAALLSPVFLVIGTLCSAMGS
jgi:hypothetical protein